jgi:hypothetical protein
VKCGCRLVKSACFIKPCSKNCSKTGSELRASRRTDLLALRLIRWSHLRNMTPSSHLVHNPIFEVIEVSCLWISQSQDRFYISKASRGFHISSLRTGILHHFSSVKILKLHIEDSSYES